jgi:hypothetical protein
MVICEPTSNVLLSVKVPPTEPTFVPSHVMMAPAFMVAPPAASARLPPTVAFDFVPLPVGSRPLLPGPAARAAAGASVATAIIAAAASQPAIRSVDPPRAERVLYVFIGVPRSTSQKWFPEPGMRVPPRWLRVFSGMGLVLV